MVSWLKTHWKEILTVLILLGVAVFIKLAFP